MLCQFPPGGKDALWHSPEQQGKMEKFGGQEIPGRADREMPREFRLVA
jgi:hypothetical protein